MQDKEKPKHVTKEGLYAGLRVLVNHLSNYKKDIVVLSVIGTLSAIGNGVIPYISGRLFDAIITPSEIIFFNFVLPAYLAILILWAIIQLITYTLDWRIQIKSEYLSNFIWLSYMTKGFGFLVNLPMSFHKKNKIGEIGSQINLAAGSLEVIAGRIVIDLAPQILSILIAVVIAFFLKPLPALILTAGLCVYIIVLLKNVKPLSGYQKEYHKQNSEFFGDAYDMIGNTIAIKQATAEEYEIQKVTTKGNATIPTWMKQIAVWGNLALYQRITILVTQILIFILSVFYIHSGQMSLGELLAFNAYAAMIFGPFVVITRNWQTIQNGIINVQETEKILSLETEDYTPKNSKTFEIRGSIVFDNVSFRYEEGKPILSNISFVANAGEVIALVGESGVGKSTLVDLVSAYHFPEKGKILIDNCPIEQFNLKSLRSQIAVVPQEVVLFNDTIKTNIKYGNFESTDEQMEDAARKAHAYDFIQNFSDKWNQIVGERGIKLSVGQKQRVAIARAILRNPKILILDEPTSALDAGSEKIITDSLNELMRGKTTFIIAHRLSTVRKADKILVFKEGRLIESGKHEDLIKLDGGEYRRLYELQIGLHG